MNTLLCTKCQNKKPELEFHKNSKSKTGHQRNCKLCNSLSVKEYYNKNNYKEKYSDKALIYTKRCKEAINLIKSKYGCCNCGEKEGICLDFHHVNSEEKDFTIAKLVSEKIFLFF